jgi:LysR family hydrogen peroxide-inducible transcriptional activator
MASLTQLEYLVAVSKFKHFGKAAQACHVSQPTLSMQLQKLEEEYGVIFFDRSKQPILPTPEGEPLIEQAKTVLREARRLEYLSKNRKKGPTGEFRLALIPTLAPYLSPLFLGKFAKLYPDVHLLIQELTTENVIEALEEDRIDAAILATPLKRDHLVEKPIFYEPFLVFTHPGHVLSKKKEVNESELDAKDIWLLAEGHCLRNQVVRVCSLRGRSGVFPNVEFESGSLETVIRMVEQGHGYTLLPYLATLNQRSNHGVLKSFSTPTPSREVSLVYRRTQFKAPVLDALFQLIRDSIPRELPREMTQQVQVIKI